ncbi:anti-sigma regulatory factor (Ser/Thr protein kinase) [Actinokineospora baliensis]|uniref:ATP-binding protein n=1 Tax=Actinokineospora baliensis TaxID=547056 RepID=UPI0019567C96|nr:ATP-binding protein [Actinokineospora baliensis]MBM7773695.1 anti-sigma regulatory factor (Ser/Thr protein kinase) [Actinokineospora baliensis]
MPTAPGAGEAGVPTAVSAVASTEGDVLTVRMPPRLDLLVTVRNHVRGWLADHGVVLETARNIVMATDEAMTNAVQHRVRVDSAEGAVMLTVQAHSTAIVVTVADNGPWQLPVQGLPIDGGFNLPLLRVLADEVHLRHQDGRSTLVAHFPHRG